MTEQVCVYGTNWCPDTVRSKQCLTRLGIKFVWRDIEKDKDACAFVERTNRGNRSVPTIVFPDGSILVEPSNAELEKKCREQKSDRH
ncbi:MAG: mrx1 [Dehalococcoidales bacterium]|nr:mrx1 [Dehalococcoidales bacterium]